MGYIERLESYSDEMLKTLGELIAVPSVNGEAVRTKDGVVLPFGKPVHDALMYMLEKGRELGFDVHNDENYAGHLEWRSEEPDEGYFGIIGHIDVMPEGSGWTDDPFTLTDRGDGFVYGRGVSDDKGPVVACLYALKALMDEGLKPHTDIRLVLGLDEETGAVSAEHYTANCGHPSMGFTPDGTFPVVNGEMGIIEYELAQKFSSKPAKDELRLTRLEGGTAPNAVPAYAKAVIAGSREQYGLISERARLYCEETGREVRTKKQGSSLVVEAAGIAAHGARPESGLNAVSVLMEFLGRISFASEELNDFIEFYNDCIGFDHHGERLGCGFSDEASGPLIFNTGMANINEELASLTINIRYPVTVTDEEVLSGIESVIGSRSIGIVTRFLVQPIYRAPEDVMVSTFLNAYREETGDMEALPEVTGGGTYAKLFDNTVAFGAMFPGEEDTMHQADEKLSKDSFMKMARIYAKAVYSLCFA